MINLLDRVELDPATGCFEWQGRVDTHGYGQVERGKKQAHRAMYEESRGHIPPGMVLHHLCENRRCVRPTHLEPVTVRTNTRLGKAMWRGACVHGHTNIGTRANGQRYCRDCNTERMRRTRNGDQASPND